MSRTGRPLALLGAAALLVSAFLPWSASGRTAIDLGLLTFGAGLSQPTVGLVLVLLATLPAVAALLGDQGWPRGVSAVLAGALVVVWLAQGPDGVVTSGAAWAMAGVATLLVSSAVADPAPRAVARYPDGASAPTPPPVDADPASPGHADRVAAPTAGRSTSHQATGERRDPPEAGRRDVPFAPRPTLEAWAPTRPACFEQLVLGLAQASVATEGLVGDGHAPVRVRGGDHAATLVALAEQVVAHLRRGRVPVGVDLFDTEDGWLAGYLELASGADVPDGLPRPAGAEVEPGPPWRARLELA